MAVTVWNPSKYGFKCKYDGNFLEEAKALEFTTYEDDVMGKHVRKHLITFIVNERNIKHTDAVMVKKVEEEIDEV